MFEKIFNFRDRDGHYVIQILGLIQLSIKHKSHFKYVKANEYGLTKDKRDIKLIVSLTSFPDRINLVHKTINTLLRQTTKPDKLILWLANSQFANQEKDLPSELIELKKFGLEIMWCDDLKSYKKLIPSLREFPNDIIVTADDDLYYEQDWLKKLYSAYLKDKNNIYVHRVSRLILNNDNSIDFYSQRKSLLLSWVKPSYLNTIFGGSGCLYPPHSLSLEVFNQDSYKNITQHADDYWFWAMAVLNKTKISEVSGKNSTLNIVDGTVESSMYKENSNFDYRKMCSLLFNKYPEILKLMREENKNA